MTLCLFCGAEIDHFIKEWKYHNGYYIVKLYRCDACHNKFREYFHNGHFSHTIPKFTSETERADAVQRSILLGNTRKIIAFLKQKKGSVVEGEIEDSLGLKIQEVQDALVELEKKGRILEVF